MGSQYTEQTIPFISTSAFEIVLDRIIEILILEEANQRVQADNSGKSQGTLTLDKNPLDGEDFIVGPKTYILQLILAVDGDIKLGSTLAETKANIVAAFDLSGVAGVQYANAMTAHPTVDIAKFDGDNAILTAKTSGVAGNSIATTSNFSESTNKFNGLTLGTTRSGAAIDANDFGFTTLKEVHDPFTAFGDSFDKVPVINVSCPRMDLKSRSKLDKKNTVSYTLDIYAQESSTETEQGVSRASETINRVWRQLIYILLSPKYPNLRLEYENEDGVLVKFIEKLSITSAEKIFPEKPLPKENVVMSQMIFSVEMVENLFDLTGPNIDIINVLLKTPLT